MNTQVTTHVPAVVQEAAEVPAVPVDFTKPVIIMPYFSCVVYTEEALKEAIEANLCEIYIFSKNGLFRRTQLTHGRHVTVPCPALPAGAPQLKMPDTKQDVSGFFPAGKIPRHFLDKIVAFFKAVMKENNGQNLEAQAFVIWNPEMGYHIRIPEQTVSGAAVTYKWENFVGPNDVVVLDMHSHNNMGAFFSGTDDRDDNGNCTISGVVGKLSTTCEMVFRFNLPGNMKIANLNIPDIFASESESFEVPPEWLSQVKREPVKTYPGYQGGNYGNYGNGTYYGAGGRGGAGQAGKNVVPNPNVRQGNLGMGLDGDDEEVLRQFGYPFVNEGEGALLLPFAHAPKTKGRKKQKVSRLPRKTR